jgi:hypothetical protein
LFRVTSYSGINGFKSAGANYGTPQTDTVTGCFGSIISTVFSCATAPTGSNPWVFAVTVTSGANTSTIEAQDSLAPNNSPATNNYSFTYYTAQGQQLGIASGDNGTVETCALYAINSINISVSFQTGLRRGGYAGNEVTTWQTTVYLQNADTTTTTPTTAPTTCADLTPS